MHSTELFITLSELEDAAGIWKTYFADTFHILLSRLHLLFFPSFSWFVADMRDICDLCTRLQKVSGPPGSPARVGTSVVDITCGLNAHAAIVTALLEREHTGKGAALKTSLFASASELMAVPLLQQAYTGSAPVNRGTSSFASPPPLRL